MDQTRISLVALTGKLAKLVPDANVTYERVWRLAAQGSIPAQQDGRSWFADPRDIPQIVRTLRGVP
jgi:hypothetical protein